MLNFLVVDDSKAVHAFITSALSKMGVNLIHVFNGQEAVDLLSSDKPPSIDLVMLDWEMPVLDGPSTFEWLHKSRSDLPVLMMTTKNNPEDISLMIGRGVNEYMLKPFTTDILLYKIEYCLGKEISRVA